jgi:hypothetical protein
MMMIGKVPGASWLSLSKVKQVMSVDLKGKKQKRGDGIDYTWGNLHNWKNMPVGLGIEESKIDFSHRR